MSDTPRTAAEWLERLMSGPGSLTDPEFVAAMKLLAANKGELGRLLGDGQDPETVGK